MAFGLTRFELNKWKEEVNSGVIAIITHYWQDNRFPNATTVTKVGCSDLNKLIECDNKYYLHPEWILYRQDYPHIDLFSITHNNVIINEKKFKQINKFNLNTRL